MSNFRTYDLAILYFKECQKLRVAGFLRNQLDRAASSIILNLGEGDGRRQLERIFSKLLMAA